MKTLIILLITISTSQLFAGTHYNHPKEVEIDQMRPLESYRECLRVAIEADNYNKIDDTETVSTKAETLQILRNIVRNCNTGLDELMYYSTIEALTKIEMEQEKKE